MPDATEVLVVGAGLAGLAAACTLAERGMRVLLVEQAPVAPPGPHAGHGEPGHHQQRDAVGRPDERGVAAHVEELGHLRPPAPPAACAPPKRR